MTSGLGGCVDSVDDHEWQAKPQRAADKHPSGNVQVSFQFCSALLFLEARKNIFQFISLTLDNLIIVKQLAYLFRFTMMNPSMG